MHPLPKPKNKLFSTQRSLLQPHFQRQKLKGKFFGASYFSWHTSTVRALERAALSKICTNSGAPRILINVQVPRASTWTQKMTSFISLEAFCNNVCLRVNRGWKYSAGRWKLHRKSIAFLIIPNCSKSTIDQTNQPLRVFSPISLGSKSTNLVEGIQNVSNPRASHDCQHCFAKKITACFLFCSTLPQPLISGWGL